MGCKKVLISNICEHWIYFNFKNCSNEYSEFQYGIPPFEHREINYIDGTLLTAFENCYQIDPNGYNLTTTTTQQSPISPTPTETTTPTPTITPTITPSTTPIFETGVFYTKWRTSLPNEDITLPLVDDGNYNFIVNWGDGNSDSITSYTQSEVTHTFLNEGDYIISISGICEGINFNFGISSNYEKLIDIMKWGDVRLSTPTHQNYFFRFTNNLTNITAPDTPNLSGITSLEGMFAECQSLETINNINNWDVSNVIYMGNLFFQTNFNSDISSWDVSNVTDMSNLFSESQFNLPIGNWNVSGVTNMTAMFYGTPFNQDISNWNVSNVTIMTNMFGYSSFNQPIGNWDVSNVAEMNSMFNNSPFNQQLSGWNVSNVYWMDSMFDFSSFNQPIGNWDTSSLLYCALMFSNCPFNQPIGNWNVSNVINLAAMFFNNTVFNQDLSNWCVNSVLNYNNFDNNTPSWTLPKPCWGYCGCP